MNNFNAIPGDIPRQTASLKDGLTYGLTIGAYQSAGDDVNAAQSGTSIFDPVLCELAYRWFCPPGGLIFDPFAGGSVRGIVASKLGRRYIGIDLRHDQIEANRVQAELICDEPKPEWICGDSTDGLPAQWTGQGVDFIFSCPPYGNLEVYSDDPRDLSTMKHAAFIAAYRAIIASAVAALSLNRFACFVVSDFRDLKTGLYRSFPASTIAAFEDAGAGYYNEAILLNAIGSLPIRTARQFIAGRKLGRCHQNVLVFVKGDPRVAAELCEKNTSE